MTMTISDDAELFDLVRELSQELNVSKSAIYAGCIRKVFEIKKTKTGYKSGRKPKTIIQ